jgi:hypothetical protein
MKQRLIKLLVFAFAFGLLAVNVPAHAGNDTSWIPTDKNFFEPSTHSFAFTDKLPLPFQFSLLQGDSYPDIYVCNSIDDLACATSKVVQYNSILKVCESTSDSDCVSSVSSVDANGTSVNGKFSRYTVLNHLNKYAAVPSLGIPAGDMPGIWSIPSAPHASGSDYAVIAGKNGNIDNIAKNGNETVVGSFMQLSLIPVVLKDYGKGSESQSGGWGNNSLPGIFYDYCTTFQQTPTNKNANCGHVNGDSCLLPTNEQGKCYAEESFGRVQRFNIQIKLTKEPTGWLHGRMVDPSISITKEPNGSVNFSVTAGATTVPMIYQTGAWANLPLNVQNLWTQCFKDQRFCGGSITRGQGADPGFNVLGETLEGNAKVNLMTYVNAFGPIPLSIMAGIAPLIGDKSQSTSTTWSMRTLAPLEMNGANSCFTKTEGLKGMVTTNSVAYSDGPPEFKDGSLNYQVASPHFNPDGTTPFKGNYNLVMRSDVARCIYGFSSAPIKASISVLSSDGANDVATTVANEKDGWLSLSANNFQFSSPTIQVKLSQDAPTPVVTPTPVATPEPTPSAAPTTPPVAAAPKQTVAAKKTTITCVKGKTTKTVTAVKPTCPTGYKKK